MKSKLRSRDDAEGGTESPASEEPAAD